jgi:hypothetical protein
MASIIEPRSLDSTGSGKIYASPKIFYRFV